MEQITLGQYDLIYNAFSFTFATMAASTLFFWLGRSQVIDQYKTALTITGLVTFIAGYHYLRIFQSWEEAYAIENGMLVATEQGFNDAYRYVDWLLTVPLLLIELVLVMGLSRSETFDRATKLGAAAALMIVLGYPGEVADATATRWLWGVLSMIPFVYIVRELYLGLKESIDRQPEDVRGLVSNARWILIGSWSFYPVVYFAGAIGLDGATAETIIQIGYTVADIVSKCVFGVIIYMIALRKSDAAIRKDTAATPAE